MANYVELLVSGIDLKESVSVELSNRGLYFVGGPTDVRVVKSLNKRSIEDVYKSLDSIDNSMLVNGCSRGAVAIDLGCVGYLTRFYDIELNNQYIDIADECYISSPAYGDIKFNNMRDLRSYVIVGAGRKKDLRLSFIKDVYGNVIGRIVIGKEFITDRLMDNYNDGYSGGYRFWKVGMLIA